VRCEDDQEVYGCILNNGPYDTWHSEAFYPGLGRKNNDHHKRPKVCCYASRLRWNSSEEKKERTEKERDGRVSNFHLPMSSEDTELVCREGDRRESLRLIPDRQVINIDNHHPENKRPQRWTPYLERSPPILSCISPTQTEGQLCTRRDMR
jgi:hypothetical protein